MGKATFHVGRPHHNKHTRRANPNPSCETGGFYQFPTFNDRVNSLEPLEIKWDTTCLDTQMVDIRLNAPKLLQSQLYVWTNVLFSTGSVTVDLKPRWWNATSEVDLQLAIGPSGKSIYSTNLKMPAPPIFTATYTEPPDGPPASADTFIGEPPYMDIQQATLSTKSGLAPGKTAAAVILPLLVVIGGILFFLRWQRKKSSKKSQRFSVAVDKRMSTISTDWKSVTAAGANAAIRNSMAVSGNRNSSFSFGGIRPNSTFTADGPENQAGIGRPSIGSGVGYGARQMSHMQTGVGLRHPASLSSYGTGERVSRVSFATDVRQSRVSFATDVRQSRVSFATDSRPSIDSRRTRFQDVYVPPVPALPPTAVTAGIIKSDDRSSEDGDAILSPRQAQGALTLTPEDIRARIAAGRARSASNVTTSHSNTGTNHDNNSSNEDIMAALSMMRTGTDQGDDYLFPAPAPPPPAAQVPPVPTSPPPTIMSPVMSTIQMPMPDSVMSPDEMLRAYAERKKSGVPVGPTGIPMAIPMSPPPQNGRMLFSPTGVVSPNNTGNGNVHQMYESVGKFGGAKYVVGDDDDVYGGRGY